MDVGELKNRPIEPEYQLVNLLCLVCETEFKHKLYGSRDPLDYVEETGYCLRCELVCVYCKTNRWCSNNNDRLCKDCYKVFEPDEKDEKDETKEVVQELLKEMLMKLESGHHDDDNDFQNLLDDVEYDNDNVSSTNAVFEKDSIQIITSVYNESHGGLGSDGSGGSINGELSTASCKIICNGLELNKDDCLCDIGSGGGFTLMRMAAESNVKVGIGIECEAERYNIAVNFNKTLMEKYPHINIPVTFSHADIQTLKNLNGFSKLYMYDKAFDDSLLKRISKTFNLTESIKFVASSIKDLHKYGFNVKLHNNLGSLGARGGNTSHTFYIYESKHYKTKAVDMETSMMNLFKVAENKVHRYEAAEKHIHAVHHSEVSPREPQVRKILNETSTRPTLYDLLTSTTSPTIKDTKYTLSETRYYMRYNEQTLKDLTVEYAAIVHKSSKSTLLAPSYDGNINGEGKILVSLYYDPMKSGGTYYGVVYDIVTKLFKNDVVSKLYNKFDHNCSFPFDITSILKVLVSQTLYLINIVMIDLINDVGLSCKISIGSEVIATIWEEICSQSD